MRILVAEDNIVARHFLRKTLEKQNHDVSVVENGGDAWESLQQEDWDVLISDWIMPGMDGVALCRRLRACDRPSYTYVILLTAKDQREDRLEALSAGADDFLVKPLDAAELSARLEVAARILAMQSALADTVAYMAIANQRFSELYMGLPVACMTYDFRGRIQEWNRACEPLFRLSAEEMSETMTWQRLYSPVHQDEVEGIIARVFAGEKVEGLEWEFSHPDGHPRYLMTHTFPLRATDGSIVGAISSHIDITERRRSELLLEEKVAQLNIAQARLEEQQASLVDANLKLETLATTDGLTGLKNHRSFQEHITHEHERSRRYGTPLSVLLLDVDHFKQYNDTYGHPAGDDVLRTVARLLRESTRDTDIVCRYGGEEFVLILSDTDGKGAVTLAERIRASIASYAWPLRVVTASFGVSSATPATASAAALVAEADAALYRSKQTGRNTVMHSAELDLDSTRPLVLQTI